MENADIAKGLASLQMDGSSDGGIISEVKSRHGHSAQPESQQVMAVLQAVLEVIQAEGMSATPTTIFAALMSALDRPDAQNSTEVCSSSRSAVQHGC
jgi:ribosomal RNA-processing protein 12